MQAILEFVADPPFLEHGEEPPRPNLVATRYDDPQFPINDQHARKSQNGRKKAISRNHHTPGSSR
jgi:hypothetical protein